MFAIEFQAKVKDGSIRIPAQYEGRFTGPVRVILMTEESQAQSDLIGELLANPLRMDTFSPLIREEIYDRR